MRKLALGITLLCALLAACGKSEVELRNGYKYVQLDGSSYAIADRHNVMVVDPNVARYRVTDRYVVGERKDANIDSALSKKFGYFILDTKNGQLIEGLNRPSYEAELRAHNIKMESSDF